MTLRGRQQLAGIKPEPKQTTLTQLDFVQGRHISDIEEERLRLEEERLKVEVDRLVQEEDSKRKWEAITNPDVVFLGETPKATDRIQPYPDAVEPAAKKLRIPPLQSTTRISRMSLRGNTKLVAYKTPDEEFTTIKARNYTGHLKSPDYIHESNGSLARKIFQWRTMVRKMIERINKKLGHSFPEGASASQYIFADKFAGDIAEEIEMFMDFPLEIMSLSAIKNRFELESVEQADFVFKMAQSDDFDLIFSPYTHLANFVILTQFDEEPRTQKGFGKPFVADFTKCDQENIM